MTLLHREMQRNMARAAHRPAERERIVDTAQRQAVYDASPLRRADAAQMAVAFQREIANEFPDHAEIQVALGRACASLGALTSSQADLHEALAAYERARQLGAADNTALRWRITINQAIALGELAVLERGTSGDRRLTEAEGLLRGVLAEMPEEAGPTLYRDFPRAQEALGTTQARQGQRGKIVDALSHFDKAIQTWPDMADRARTLNSKGVAYERLYRDDPTSSHWLDEALAAYATALTGLRKRDMPLEWSRTQRNYCDALQQKAERSQDRHEIERLLAEAIDGLKEARALCTDAVSPSLRASIHISLGNTAGILAYLKEDRYLALNALHYYINAARKVDTDIKSEIARRADSISQLFNFTPRRFMERRTSILSSVKLVLLEHAVTFEEWEDISAQIAEQFTDKTSDLAAAGGIKDDGADPIHPETRVQVAGATHAPAQQTVPPMPTTEELEREGKLYSQAYTAARAEHRKYDIIAHLLATWVPWIETGELTRPELLARDNSAYFALARWLQKPDHDLKTALGGNRDIPTRSETAQASLTPEGIREARRISSLLRRAAKRDLGQQDR